MNASPGVFKNDEKQREIDIKEPMNHLVNCGQVTSEASSIQSTELKKHLTYSRKPDDERLAQNS